MTDWACHKCIKGMIYDKERKLMVLCDCPKGEAKKRWLDSTPEERENERVERGRRKKRGKAQERIPF